MKGISSYSCLQWLYYRDFRLFWSLMTLLQWFQTIFGLQRFQTFFVFSDSFTGISNNFCLHWLYDRDFKLILSSVSLLKAFQTIFVFSDSITGISDYFGIQWFYYRTFRLFLSSENWYSQTCLNCLRILQTLLSSLNT